MLLARRMFTADMFAFNEGCLSLLSVSTVHFSYESVGLLKYIRHVHIQCIRKHGRGVHDVFVEDLCADWRVIVFCVVPGFHPHGCPFHPIPPVLLQGFRFHTDHMNEGVSVMRGSRVTRGGGGVKHFPTGPPAIFSKKIASKTPPPPPPETKGTFVHLSQL